MRIFFVFAGVLLAACSQAESVSGELVYAEHCSQCHEGGVPKAPHKMFLQMLAPDLIYGAMTDGIMQAQSAPSSD